MSNSRPAPAPGDPADRSERICVFSPSPLFRVTLEQRSGPQDEVHFHAGGQGVWVSRMIRVLGGVPVLCAPFGGESGLVLRRLIEAEDVALRAVASRGPNGGEVHDRRRGERRELAVVASPELSRHELDDLYSATLVEAIDAGVLVLTGPAQERILPSDTFRRLALDASANGVRVLADLSGDALHALRGGVHLLKVSHLELIAAGLAADEGEAELLAGVERLRERGAANVVVSRAGEPALVSLDGRIAELAPPRLEEVDHHGAGDSMTAAFAVATARGLSDDAMLRLAGAAGALNVTRHGLGSGQRAMIERFAERVEVRRRDGGRP